MISNDEFLTIQKLCKIKISSKEEDSFKEKLGSMLDMLSQIKTINCSDIASQQYNKPSKKTREDIVQHNNSIEELFRNIPKNSPSDIAKNKQSFVVPKMIN